jgi:lipopolysaccharide transport system ATP-binding protein
MAQPIIQVEGLGKKYLVGHQAAERERYTTLRDVLARNVRGLWRKTRDIARGRQLVTGDIVEDFWALRDVSLNVQLGEVVAPNCNPPFRSACSPALRCVSAVS